MEKELNAEWDRLEEKFEKLPENAQRAVCWVIKNWDFVTGICKESSMTCEEIEKYKKKADEEGDYVLFVLLCMIETYKAEALEQQDPTFSSQEEKDSKKNCRGGEG